MTNTRKIASGSMLSALSILFLYLSSIIPVNKFYLLGIASAIITVSILITGLKNSLLVFTVTSILSLFLVSSKFTVMAYILFFGLYGFIKFFIEKFNKLIFEIPLKLCFFNLALASGLLLANIFVISVPVTKYPLYILLLPAQLVFLVYDYALTIFISYFHKKYLKFFL